ncbi:MAG: hypothetical protein G01um101429_751 [Parcubacteria group bacterium Gr01-1014_29]|nr:MAG: hypothetical protein G01um101429_751 [Parcubacteria group bacterium Gr01-1014_29]
MDIKIIKDKITKEELKKIAEERFGDLAKAVVDVEQGIMAVGGELHADEEVLLVEQEGSQREYTWGINLYPDRVGDDFIEYDSMINLKPTFGNRTRNVENAIIREQIKKVVGKLVKG